MRMQQFRTEIFSRHVLLNGSYGRLILKMSLLSVICDGYVSWSSLQSSSSAERELFFEQEYQFYVRCTRAAAGEQLVLIGKLSSKRLSFLRSCNCKLSEYWRYIRGHAIWQP